MSSVLIIPYPNTILWETSIDCQYSSGTKLVCMKRELTSRRDINDNNRVFSDDMIFFMTDGPRTSSSNKYPSSSSLNSCISSSGVGDEGRLILNLSKSLLFLALLLLIVAVLLASLVIFCVRIVKILTNLS